MTYSFKSGIKAISAVCGMAALFITLWFLGYNFVTHTKTNTYHIVFSIAFTILVSGLISLADMVVMQWLQYKFPWQKSKIKRIVLEYLLTSFNAVVIISAVISIIYALTGSSNYPNVPVRIVYFQNITISLIVNTIAVSIINGLVFLKQWKEALIESEALRRERAEAQYASLKNQVNPHFLFNSLNTLSALIRTNKDKALDFVDNFSKIYRYVLEVNDKIVIELHHELDFLQHYYYLQQLRYGNSLMVEVNVPAEFLNKFVLPLSIQIIVENAIKHNEISTEKPLKIRISVEDKMLVIANNLQKRDNMDESLGIGLNNLTGRYQHISAIAPEFVVENGYYIARLPILEE